MKIVKEFPPNFTAIAKKFDLEDLMPVFAYGNVLYNPTGGPIADHLMKHEETHEIQQRNFGSVEGWWNEYLSSDTFRLTQEVEAYREQYRSIKHYSREIRRQLLNEMVRNLSGKLYGKIINKEVAQDLIKNG